MTATPIQAGPTFVAEKPAPLFEAGVYVDGGAGRNYEVSPDGGRFVLIQTAGESGAIQIVVVEHWFDELKARVPAK